MSDLVGNHIVGFPTRRLICYLPVVIMTLFNQNVSFLVCSQIFFFLSDSSDGKKFGKLSSECVFEGTF